MVTFATVVVTFFILVMIIIIDMLLYDVSFLTAAQMLFLTHMSVGKTYLIITAIFGFGSAILIDFRRIKSQ